MAPGDDESMNDVEQGRRANSSSNSVELKRRAASLGFAAIGMTTLEANAHAAELDAWLDRGYAGTMRYLHRQAAKRKDPRAIFRGARVAVVTLTNYFHAADPGPMARGRVAQYAWSRDYHLVLRDRHEQLAAIVRELSPGARTSVYIDAGPVPERELAQHAGLG